MCPLPSLAPPPLASYVCNVPERRPYRTCNSRRLDVSERNVRVSCQPYDMPAFLTGPGYVRRMCSSLPSSSCGSLTTFWPLPTAKRRYSSDMSRRPIYRGMQLAEYCRLNIRHCGVQVLKKLEVRTGAIPVGASTAKRAAAWPEIDEYGVP